MQRFAVILEPADEGGFIARVPALPGCVTEGDTREEALAMARDAIRGYWASLKKHGEWPARFANPVTFVDVDEATI
jgi:antitoxin HicB